MPAAARYVVDQTIQKRAAAPNWLGPPRRSPLTAMIWKQLRESLPLPLLGAATIVLAAIWMAAQEWDSPAYGANVFQISYGVWMTMGSFVAIVAGIGAFMDDLRPGLHTFWRSRPISVNQWFAVKFTLSLLTTVVILAVPPLVVAACFWTQLDEIRVGGDDLPAIYAMSVAMQISLFTAAAAAMTLVRHAIYAAILTVGAAMSYGVTVAVIMESMASPLDPAMRLVHGGDDICHTRHRHDNPCLAGRAERLGLEGLIPFTHRGHHEKNVRDRWRHSGRARGNGLRHACRRADARRRRPAEL